MDDGGEEEEEDAADGDRKAGSVQAADITPIPGTRSRLVVETSAQGSVDDTTAFVGAMSGVVCDGSETANKQNVKDDGEGGEDGHTANA